jgi:hypothetical protein
MHRRPIDRLLEPLQPIQPSTNQLRTGHPRLSRGFSAWLVEIEAIAA